MFFVYDDGAADDVEQSRCGRDVFGAGILAFAECGHALPENAGSVGHGANDGSSGTESALDLRGVNGCSDGDYQLLGRDFVGNLFGEFLDDLRLDAKENDVRAIDGGNVVGGHVDAEFVGEFVRAGFMGDGGA